MHTSSKQVTSVQQYLELHHANTLLGHRYKSSTCGHSHKRDLKFKDGAKAIGLVAGCYKGAEEGWAGQSNLDWWKGVVIKREIDNGMYEPEFVSLKRLKEVYGKNVVTLIEYLVITIQLL